DVIDGAAGTGQRLVGLQEDESDFTEKEAVVRLPRRPGLQANIFRIPLDRLRRVGNAEMHVVVRQRLSHRGRYPWRRLCDFPKGSPHTGLRLTRQEESRNKHEHY